MSAVLLGFGAGFDNLRSAVALALLDLSPAARWRLAAGFVAAELLGPLLGVALARVVPADVVWVARPVAIAAVLAIAISSVIGRPRILSELLEHPAGAAGLPLLLGLDNVAAGMALGLSASSPIGAAVVAGGISGLMAAAGVWIGVRLSRVTPHAELVGAALLVLFAAVLLINPAQAA